MKNIILITTDINESYNFAANIIDAKKHIMAYFGSKHAEHNPETPSVIVNTEVCKADIDHIYNLIDDSAIRLIIILTNENSEKRLDGDFIDVRE